jgi:hypothetical protein
MFLERKFCDNLCSGNRRVFRNVKFFLFISVNKDTHLASCRGIPNVSTLQRPMYPRVMYYCAQNKRHLDGTLDIQLRSTEALSTLLHDTLFRVVSNVLVVMKHFSLVFKLHKPKIKKK